MIRKIFGLVAVMTLLTVTALTQTPPQPAQPAQPAAKPPAIKTTLKVGDKAPDFTLVGVDGKTVQLKKLKGKTNVVLAFYPKAFTGGCTKEMKAYQADIAKFEASGAKVYGISTDPLDVNTKFHKELGLTFPLLSDTNNVASKTYGILNENSKMAMRATFVIDKKGVITYIEEGTAAVNIEGAVKACSVFAGIMKKKS